MYVDLESAAAPGAYDEARALEAEAGCCGSERRTCSAADESLGFGSALDDEATLAAARCEEIEIPPTHPVHEHARSAIIRARKPEQCCSAQAQGGCCEPAAKAECCGEDHAPGACGCRA